MGLSSLKGVGIERFHFNRLYYCSYNRLLNFSAIYIDCSVVLGIHVIEDDIVEYLQESMNISTNTR